MSGRDIGASVRQRLLNRSRAQSRPFQELLQYFAMERFLYRLASSSVVDRFVLKGALLLTAWQAPLSRPTMDIDLAGRTSNELDHISEIVRAVCSVRTEPDGIEFDPTSIEVARIKEGAEYERVRVTFIATLARARIPMQIDIGFGDVIVPLPTQVEYPTLLDFPAPVLLGDPKDTVVAEKLEALTTLGLLNSRVKDYYDLALLSRTYPFVGRTLVDAIAATFRHRKTVIDHGRDKGGCKVPSPLPSRTNKVRPVSSRFARSNLPSRLKSAATMEMPRVVPGYTCPWVNVPSPLPRKMARLVALGLAPVAARSTFPSPLKSPTGRVGNCRPGDSEGCGDDAKPFARTERMVSWTGAEVVGEYVASPA